jgi:hypothetical protein
MDRFHGKRISIRLPVERIVVEGDCGSWKTARPLDSRSGR